MWILQLAWKNLWRNKSRTWITISSVFFATLISTLASSLKEGIFDELVSNIVSSFTGHIQINQKGYQEEQILENAFYPPDSIRSLIQTTNGIEAITGRLMSFALVSNVDNTKGCMVVGVENQEINKFMTLENKLLRGNLMQNNSNEVMIARELSKQLKVEIHDTMVLIGQGYHGSTAGGKFPVSGIIDMGSPILNKQLVVMPLQTAQQLFSADSLVTSWIILTSTHIKPEILAKNIEMKIGNSFETLTWGELLPDIKQHIDADSGNMQIIQFILYFLVSFGIFSTLLIMMTERKRENGMLLALGMHRARIQLLIFSELLCSLMMGSLTGIFFAYPIALMMKKYPLQITGKLAETYSKFGFEPIFPTSTNPIIFIQQYVTVFIMGIILGLYPMWLIQKMNPLNAMKK